VLIPVMNRYYVDRDPRVNPRTGVTGYDVSTIVAVKVLAEISVPC
jgi:hypothetical protein